eukprot:COSAG06_NODE_4468_length_4222_cov_7.124667_1_plen_152_part_00
MAAFNGNTDDTHNTPHDTVPFQLPAKGKETRKVLTAALQFVFPDLQYAQRQEYSMPVLCLPVLCLAWHSRYAGTTSRPLCTSGPFWSGVEPVGTPDHNCPEVHRRSAVVPRPRGRSILGSADLASPFYHRCYNMVLIRCGTAVARDRFWAL